MAAVGERRSRSVGKESTGHRNRRAAPRKSLEPQRVSGFLLFHPIWHQPQKPTQKPTRVYFTLQNQSFRVFFELTHHAIEHHRCNLYEHYVHELSNHTNLQVTAHTYHLVFLGLSTFQHNSCPHSRFRGVPDTKMHDISQYVFT